MSTTASSLKTALRQTRLVALGAAVALLWTPTAAAAHEKWFTNAGPYPVQLDLLFSLPVALAVLSAAGALGALLLIRRVVVDPLGPTRRGYARWAHRRRPSSRCRRRSA